MVNLRIAWITGLSIDISRRLEGRSFVFKIDDMILNCSSPEALRKLPPMHYKKIFGECYILSQQQHQTNLSNLATTVTSVTGLQFQLLPLLYP